MILRPSLSRLKISTPLKGSKTIPATGALDPREWKPLGAVYEE
jgi:hypothetical protein